MLKPFNLTANITTKNPTILLDGKKLEIKDVKTNVSLKSLIFNEFSVDSLEISTKSIMINDVISLAKSVKNSTELFLLDKIISDGFLIADIKLKFDEEGRIRNDYQINGFIKNGKINFLNKFNVNNLNFSFDINEKKDLFLINGKFLTSEKNFNKDKLISILDNLFKNLDVEKVRFSSENDFSFNINKKLKFNDLNIDSKINLNKLVIKNDFINLKSYLPNFNEVMSFENHKIIINYDKDQLKIKGKGEVLIDEKSDSINYQIIKNNEKFIFDTKTNLKNNKLLIDFLNYEKKENLEASILIKGEYQKNHPIKLNLISLVENNNNISFKNLNLSKVFKFINIDSFNFDYLNNKKIKNKLYLKKNNSNYIIEGDNFDATTLINKIMDGDDENRSLFSNFNSEINIKINKTYIDEVNFINNLYGTLNFKNNKMDYLDLKSTFPNKKTLNLSIKTNNQQEIITKLFTDYPKPLIKRYNFIKGFEEGYLDYYSIKKNGTSNSRLIIDNFKVKEVPVFAKILSLASLQGIADLLTGEGIRFTDFEMKFSNNKKLTTIEEMYAIGPAVSILMDGYIESKKLISLNGTLVPATTINRTIASIPLLGNILVGKKTGEGVFGVSYKIKGPPEDLRTTVNPIKTLTPRFITRTLEKIKKN